jgi:uncharacterized protein
MIQVMLDCRAVLDLVHLICMAMSQRPVLAPSLKPLALFFALAYGLSWLMWLPLYGPALGIHGLPVLPLHHALGALGPLLAALFATWLWDGKDGCLDLLRRMVASRALPWLALALFSPFVLAGIAGLLHQWVDGVAVDFSALLTNPEFPEMNLLTFFLYNLVFFGFGEEAGWRGFALPRLQKGLHPLVASLVLTVFWAVWHWPLFLYRPGYVQMDVAGMVGWLMSLLTGTVLLTWLYNGSRGSIVVCAMFHATVDIAFTADWDDAAMAGWLGGLVTVWGVAVAVVLLLRKHRP